MHCFRVPIDTIANENISGAKGSSLRGGGSVGARAKASGIVGVATNGTSSCTCAQYFDHHSLTS